MDRFIRSLRDAEAEAKSRFKTRAEQKAMDEYYEELLEKWDPYGGGDDEFDKDQFQKVVAAIQKDNRFDILSDVYVKALEEELEKDFPEFAVIRNVLRNAAKYRVRSLCPVVLEHFEQLLPMLREVVLYLLKVLTKELVKQEKKAFKRILTNRRMQLPFANTWLTALLEHPAFNAVGIPANYDEIRSLRGRALLAIRRRDRTWVKGYKNAVDTLGPWDKRAVLYSAKILSRDEKRAWMRIAAKRADQLEAAITKFVVQSENN